jgi:hypothetical protein
VDPFRNPKLTECVEGAFHLQARTRCIGTFSLALRNSHCNFLRCGRIRLCAATNLTQAKSPLIGRPLGKWRDRHGNCADRNFLALFVVR